VNENPEEGLVIGAAAASDVATVFSPKEKLFEATTGAGTETEAAVDEEEDTLSVAVAATVFSTTLVEPNENGASEFGIEMENFDAGNDDDDSAAAVFSLSPTGCEALPKGAEGRRLETAADVALSLMADEDEEDDEFS